MRWYYKRAEKSARSNSSKLKDLVLNLVSEPVNLFIAAALLLVSFGYDLASLPYVIQDTMQRLSIMMTPLVLLFIGIAVNIRKNQFFEILAMLSLRAGLVVILAAVFIYFTGLQSSKDILLLVAFSLSACSFWPFAHIAAVESQEADEAIAFKVPTFNSNYAIGILALSFPLSVFIILFMFSSGEVFASINNLVILGFGLCTPGFIFIILNQLGKVRSTNQRLDKTTYQIPASERS